MGKRQHGFHRVKRHLIISYNIQDLQDDNTFCQDPFLCDLRAVDLYPAAAVTKLQHFALTFLDFYTVCHPAFGEIPHQKTFQLFLFSLYHALFQRSVYIQDQVMFFFTVKLHVQLQHHICLQDPLFPVTVRLHFHGMMKNRNFNVGDQVFSAACAFHFTVKRQRIFQPLGRIFRFCSHIQGKNRQFTLRPDFIILRPQIQVAGFYCVP